MSYVFIHHRVFVNMYGVSWFNMVYYSVGIPVKEKLDAYIGCTTVIDLLRLL